MIGGYADPSADLGVQGSMQMRRGAIILCGGKSSRMGRDKATLPFGPELMLQRVVRLIGEVVEPGEHRGRCRAGPDRCPSCRRT